MQNREKLVQTGHDRSRKRHVARGGKIYFSEGGGINIVFGPKYGPLVHYPEDYKKCSKTNQPLYKKY
jgi:hypothetical protein